MMLPGRRKIEKCNAMSLLMLCAVALLAMEKEHSVKMDWANLHGTNSELKGMRGGSGGNSWTAGAEGKGMETYVWCLKEFDGDGRVR